MAEARGLRDVKAKAGTFVLCSLLIGVTGVFLAGRAQGWFEKTLTVKTASVALPADSTLGLQSGAEVQILGSTVGTVTAVKIDEDTAATGAAPALQLRFAMRIRGPMMDLVRKDSQVLLKRKFGVAGSAFVQITPGRGAALAEDTQLACTIAPDLTVMVEDTLRNFNRPDSPAQKALANIEVITSNLVSGKGAAGKLISDEATAASINQTLANIEKLTASLTKSDSIVGKLVNDAQTGGQLSNSMKSVEQSLGNINAMLAQARQADINGFLEQIKKTLEQVQGALKEVTATTASLRGQAKDLPGLIGQSQEMMRQTTRMIEGVQKTWLLRDYVAPEGSRRLAPGDVP